MRTGLLFIACMLASTTLCAQTKEEMERRRYQIQAEIEELQRQQKALTKDKKASIGQLNLVQARLQKRYAVIESINSELRLIDDNIYANNREIYRLQRQIDTLRDHYARTIEYSYKNRSSYDMLNFIFTSSSFNDAMRRVAYLKSYRDYRENQVMQIERTRNELKKRIGQLSQNKERRSMALEEQNKQKSILEEEKKEKAGVVTQIKAREKDIASQLSAKKKTEQALRNSIAIIVRREIEDARRKAAAEEARRREEELRRAEANRIAAAKAAGNSTSGTPSPTAAAKPAPAPESAKSTPVRKETVLESTPEVTRVSVGFENNRRNLPWPLDVGTVTSGFGKRAIEGTRLVEDNMGITIATREGASVKAVFEGVVSSVFNVAGSQAVTIKHGKYFTTYYNLSVVGVAKGARVSMGQPIGKAGTNDYGDGEIIFVVNVEKDFVDPMNWLKAR